MQPGRKKATLFVALIFLCGGLAGAVATNLWVKAQTSVRTARADSPSASRRVRSVEWFTQQLNLSPDQASQLTQILDETRSTFRTKEKEIDTIREQARNRIRAILNEEQRAKYEELRVRKDRKRGPRR